MAVTAAALRELHRLHRQLSELRDRLERGPRQVAAREKNVQRLTIELQQAHDAAQQAKKTNDEKQLDLKTSEQKIVDLRAKLNTAASNKEYQTLLEQIDAAEMANSVLSDEILEGFDTIDQLGEKANEAEQRFAAGQAELDKTKTAVEEGAASIQADLTRLEEELAAAEAALPAEFKADYRRIVKHKGPDGLAEVDDGVCTGCGHRITLNMQNELQLSRLVFCKACGCLLYLPEL